MNSEVGAMVAGALLILVGIVLLIRRVALGTGTIEFFNIRLRDFPTSVLIVIAGVFVLSLPFVSRASEDPNSPPATPSPTATATGDLEPAGDLEPHSSALRGPTAGNPRPTNPAPGNPASRDSVQRVSVQRDPVPTEAFRIIELFLRADPFDYTGPCPVTITFSGRISVAGGGGTVSYRFARSDGASAPIQTLSFSRPGSQDVQTTWTLGGPGFTYSGWQAIETFDPQPMSSERANFTIICT
jgi:hypothetical protein